MSARPALQTPTGYPTSLGNTTAQSIKLKRAVNYVSFHNQFIYFLMLTRDHLQDVAKVTVEACEVCLIERQDMKSIQESKLPI